MDNFEKDIRNISSPKANELISKEPLSPFGSFRKDTNGNQLKFNYKNEIIGLSIKIIN